MKTVFEALMTGLDEVEDYLAGKRDKYEVHVSSDLEAVEALQPEPTKE